MEKSQQRIIIAAAIVCGAILLLWLFVLVPRIRKTKSLAGEAKTLRLTIEEIEVAFGGRDGFARGMMQVQQEVDELERKLYAQESISEILKILSLEARAGSVEVVSIRPGKAKVYLDDEGKPLLLKDYPARMLPVKIKLEGEFRALGVYLESLAQKLPVLFTVEELEIEKHDVADPRLKAELRLSTFMVRQ